MRIHDISLAISEDMPSWPGDPAVRIRRTASINDGSPANLSELTMGSHAGTHVDPPLHFMDGGTAADALALDALIGPALVVEAAGDVIGARTLQDAGVSGEGRVLIKTKNSGFYAGGGFREDYAYLTPDAARYLAGSGVRLVGVDYLSLDGFKSEGQEVHRALLEAGVVILEGLDLSGVMPGRYQLVCLPLRLKDGDGAPARAVLIET